MVPFKITAVMLFGMVGSPILASAAEPSTKCDPFDVRCPVSTSTLSGSLILPEASTPSPHAQPTSLCLKISRSLNATIPGTQDSDGCVQIVGIFDKSSALGGAVSGHYCSSNGVINLLRVAPDEAIELQPDMLIGSVTVDNIEGHIFANIEGEIYLKASNNPDEGYSKGPGFKLELVDGCPSN